jgi:hypothetical protein
VAASPVGCGGSAGGVLESRSNRRVDSISQSAQANEELKLVPPELKPDASSVDRGIRKKRPTPKKTAMVQPAISPTDIR